MGCDYASNRSCSYQRFDRMITKFVMIIGGNPSFEIPKETEIKFERSENGFSVRNEFGFLSVDSQKEKFCFPKNADPAVAEFCNHPYQTFSSSDTKKIYKEAVKHLHEFQLYHDKCRLLLKEDCHKNYDQYADDPWEIIASLGECAADDEEWYAG